MASKDIVREENILVFLDITESDLADLRTAGLPYIDLDGTNRLYNIESVATWIMTKEFFGEEKTTYFGLLWDSVYNGYNTISVNQSSDFDIAFHIPKDFGTLVSAKLICIPGAGAGGSGKSITLSSQYAAEGEDYDENTESDTDNYTLAASADIIGSLDLSAVLSDLDPLDIVSVNIQHNAIGGTVYYIGLELKYTPGA